MLHKVRFRYFSSPLSVLLFCTYNLKLFQRNHWYWVEPAHWRSFLFQKHSRSGCRCMVWGYIGKISIAWLRYCSLTLRHLFLKITAFLCSQRFQMPVKNTIAQWIEDWAWIIEQLPFLLNQEWRGFPKRTPLHSCGKVTHVEHGLGFVICALIYLVEKLHMLQWQKAIETFLGFETFLCFQTEQDRICVIKQKINLMEFYDLCHTQWLCIAYRTQCWVTYRSEIHCSLLWAESSC